LRRFSPSLPVHLATLFLLSIGYLFPCTAWSGPTSWEAGLRAGASIDEKDESFNQYDMALSYGLPWSWQWGRSIQVDTHLTTSVGVLEGGDDAGLVGQLGFAFVFGSAINKRPVEIRAGSALTLISEHEYGDDDFGGPVQFTHHISLYYWLMDELSLMARLQHMSNAGLYSENPGLDMVMLGMIYCF